MIRSFLKRLIVRFGLNSETNQIPDDRQLARLLYRIERNIGIIEDSCKRKMAQNQRYSDISQFSYGLMLTIADSKTLIQEYKSNNSID